MQKIDYSQLSNNPVIQLNWRKGFIPFFSGVTLGDGRMIGMNEASFLVGKTIQNQVGCSNETTVDNFLANSGEFGQMVVMTTRIYIDEIASDVICGEGEMGNEGFVALIRGDILIWSGFFTMSNPFYELKRQNNSIIAKSTHEIFWEFPLFEPWEVKVLGYALKI